MHERLLGHFYILSNSVHVRRSLNKAIYTNIVCHNIYTCLAFHVAHLAPSMLPTVRVRTEPDSLFRGSVGHVRSPRLAKPTSSTHIQFFNSSVAVGPISYLPQLPDGLASSLNIRLVNAPCSRPRHLSG